MTMSRIAMLLGLLLPTLAACNAPKHYDVAPRTAGTSTMVLFNGPPTIDVIDVGFPGASAGDSVAWHAPLTTEKGDLASEVGIATGTMTMVRTGRAALPGEDGNRQHRATKVLFDWHESPDSLVIIGAHRYSEAAIESDSPMLRAIVGGTGRFIGARGEVRSTPLGDGWYEHRITLVD